ncbi:MAG: hypothetical protein V4496_01965 [Pseudomonadota bacterium]
MSNHYDEENQEKKAQYQQGIERGKSEEIKSWLSRCANFLNKFDNPILMSDPKIAANIRKALAELESYLWQDMSEEKRFFSENPFWLCNALRPASVVSKDQFQALANWYSQVYEKPTDANKAKRNFCPNENAYDARDEAEIHAHAKFRTQMQARNAQYYGDHIYKHHGSDKELVEDICALLEEKHSMLLGNTSKHTHAIKI